jgi:putative inorganic carbon (hco3(-)) transporter
MTRLARFVEVSVILGFFLAVLAFGGTEPASFAIVEVLFLGLAAFLAFEPRRMDVPVPWRTLAIPTALTCVVLIQLCPLPASWLQGSGGRGNFIAGTRVGRLTFETYSTRVQLLVVLTCIAAFYLGQVVSQNRDSKRRLVVCLVTLGTFEAFYGLVQYLTGWQMIFAYAKKYDLAEATGTYINRNHYAGFLEMVLPFGIGLVLYEFRNLGKSQHAGGVRLRTLVSRRSFQRLTFWLLVSVVLFAALIFSRSRMGIIAACASLLVMCGLVAASRRQRGIALGLLAAFLALSIVFAFWIGPGPIAERFSTVGQEYSQGDQSRISIWHDALRLIWQHPLLGTGLGTFPIAFQAFQTSFLGQFVNHAHNDYLEIASDLGLPAAVMLFASVFVVLTHAVRTYFSSKENLDRIVAAGCVGSIVALLLHSMADFNLHIPANSLIFSLILGLGISGKGQTLETGSHTLAG